MKKVVVFYDGNYLLHCSNYYNYVHSIKRRLSISGLHKFIVHQAQELTGERCCLSGSHYFRGRLNAVDALARGNQLYNDRVFDDILMSEGIQTHYLPLRMLGGKREESGTNVGLSLEALEMAMEGKIDVAVFLISDTDYVPLFRKLRMQAIPIVLLGWDFEYTAEDGQRMVTKTSCELRSLSDSSLAMHDVIEQGLEQRDPIVESLFGYAEQHMMSSSLLYEPTSGSEPGREVSQVMTIKNNYGFIKYPKNNLFFHQGDVINGDFYDIAPGDSVEFSLALNDNGQEVARRVEKL